MPTAARGTMTGAKSGGAGGVNVTAEAACSASSFDKTASDTTVTRPALAAGGVLITSLLEYPWPKPPPLNDAGELE